MHKIKRRREVPADVHSEDEEEFDVTRGVLEFSDISDSEPSCEDSDVESEASHSEGEEEMQEEIKEESGTTKGELNLTKEKSINSVHEDACSLVEDTISTSSEDISEIVTKSKGAEKSISTSKQKLEIDGQLEIKQEENDAITVTKDSNDSSAEELQSRSDDENDAQDEKCDDSQNSVSVPEMSGWQKKVLARQEYRKKLAEDPAFVPHLGEFWGHDDRFIKDEFKDDFDSNYRPFASRGKGVWGNSPPRGRWDHDGFEELMRIEDEERHRKEFQRRVQHRREFVPPAPRRSHFHNNNVTHNSHSSNSIRRVRNSFEEQSRSRGMFLPKYDTRNKGENINSNNLNHHKSSVRESRSENSNSGKIASTAKDNSFLSKGGFRGRGYSSRHYMRSSLNRDHSFNYNQTDGKVDVRHNIDQDKSKGQQLNGNDNDVDNIKNSHAVCNAGQHEGSENEFKDNINTVAKYQTEKVKSAQGSTDVTPNVNVSSSSFAKEGTEPGSLIKDHEKSNKVSEPEVDIVLDSQSRKATIDNETNSISRSINNVTSSFNDLSINNNPSEIIGSLLSTPIDKDRVQTNQASKRYSTRRTASSSITQQTHTNDTNDSNDSLVSGVSDHSRTSEIPPSAVFAPPFQPRALALSDENSISNEDLSNNFFPQKPETPAYYMDNLPQGLRNNENNLPQQTSIPTPAPYVTESNGMVYYYDPMYYYYYPTHTTPELKDTNDSSVKSSSFVPQPTTNVQENNGVYYYYPIYYQ